MKIGIDARMYGPKVGGGGLGRYVEKLVEKLQQVDKKNRYILFLKKENIETCEIENPNFKKRLANIHWYGYKEQLFLPWRIDKEKLDLIHFPHWNVPFFIKTPYVVTIHDLILLEEPTSAKITTRRPWIFHLKHLAFRLTLNRTLRRAQKIIAVSNYTKQSILRYFPDINPEKIQVIYEGITQLKGTELHPSAPLPFPYLLYVGNAYPHKNLEFLLQTYYLFSKRFPDIHLVLAGRRDVFYRRLEQMAVSLDLGSHIHFINTPSDEELKMLYKSAKAYVFPSRIEGFGLPPLEAMSFGVPVIAARASCLPEILGEAAHYFSATDKKDLTHALENILFNKPLRSSLKENGFKQITKYSWKNMAEEVRTVYENNKP